MRNYNPDLRTIHCKKIVRAEKVNKFEFYGVFHFPKLIKFHFKPRHHHFQHLLYNIEILLQFQPEDVYPINFHLPIHSQGSFR